MSTQSSKHLPIGAMQIQDHICPQKHFLSPHPCLLSIFEKTVVFNKEATFAPFFTVSGCLFNHSEMLFVLCRCSLKPEGDVSARGEGVFSVGTAPGPSAQWLITQHQPRQLLTQNRWRSGLCKQKIPERQTICKHT